MNNEELKKKIVEIIINAIWKDAEADYDSTDETEAGSIADALIAAGIVDKSDYASMKETAVRYKAEVSKAGARVKEAEAEANRYEMLYKLQNRDMALAERRAHDAEHRAARAEKALRNCVEYYRFTHLCPIPDCECSDKCWGETCVSDIVEYLEEQAEKELAEERKDGKLE